MRLTGSTASRGAQDPGIGSEKRSETLLKRFSSSSGTECRTGEQKQLTATVERSARARFPVRNLVSASV